MKTTVDSFVITEEDTSQEEAALKMAASGVVDINQFWQRIKEFKLPLDISPEGKLCASHFECKANIQNMRHYLLPTSNRRSSASSLAAVRIL